MQPASVPTHVKLARTANIAASVLSAVERAACVSADSWEPTWKRRSGCLIVLVVAGTVIWAVWEGYTDCSSSHLSERCAKEKISKYYEEGRCIEKIVEINDSGTAKRVTYAMIRRRNTTSQSGFCDELQVLKYC
jgi:hypothetical protein